MKNRSALSPSAPKTWRAASRPAIDPRTDGNWFAVAADVALKFGPDVLMPASTTCAVIYYHRTEWPLLLFVFGVNCVFLVFRFVSRKSFG